MSSLFQSRWAPKPSEHKTQGQPPPAASPGRRMLLSPAGELSRFMKIVARLKWKLPFLAEGYRLATRCTDPTVAVAHAEVMFKIDFHEYYALLERALVHLLGVFGITVSAAGKVSGTNSVWSTHRYHANVLEALEDENCPLHSVFRNGNVYEQLKKAKELRNRWKSADLSEQERERESMWSPRREKTMPLQNYDFDNMLADIFDGLEEGCRLAQEHVANIAQSNHSQAQADSSNADWDFIVDAMDWEAV
ncbi:uncharacterized protein CDV56_107477 [Aspergillus thermomutatus]|uniref:Uncharacterized protein n=1 Tax=Aspergillus thermomutatus TaxID=41047 RepID=A0A397H336_ASPTH|nr:uncharacterized protein CDV56_107477 [Aspergillus thermomutatus]RHZ57492.1 hypothetical protein CDV56_107477 [Aspergillus thermomutatus]